MVSWITSAEYYLADGKGYLIIGTRGSPCILENVPSTVWRSFKADPSFRRYKQMGARYPFELER